MENKKISKVMLNSENLGKKYVKKGSWAYKVLEALACNDGHLNTYALQKYVGGGVIITHSGFIKRNLIDRGFIVVDDSTWKITPLGDYVLSKAIHPNDKYMWSLLID